jgi:hypothetical protein
MSNPLSSAVCLLILLGTAPRDSFVGEDIWQAIVLVKHFLSQFGLFEIVLVEVSKAQLTVREKLEAQVFEILVVCPKTA